MKKDNLRKIKDVSMPGLMVRAVVSPDSVNEEERTVQVQYTTGARVFRSGYGWTDDYYEELSTKKGDVRLERLKSGNVPVLNTHRSMDLGDVLGTVIDGDETTATIKFSEREELEGIWRDIKSGVIKNISVGYRVHKYQDVTKEDEDVKVLRAVDWEVMEISFVPIGADGAAGTRSHADEKNSCVIVRSWDNSEEEEEDPMKKDKLKKDNVRSDDQDKETPETEVDADDDAPADEAPATEKPAEDERSEKELIQRGVELEKERQSEIRKAVRSVSLPDSFADELINQEGMTVEKARAAVINEMAERSDQTKIKSRVQVGEDIGRQSRMQGMEDYILHRAHPGKNQLDENSQQYRGLSMIDLARESLPSSVDTRGMPKMEIVKRAFESTSDFTTILANVANKSLRVGYGDTKKTFMDFSRQITLTDFKPSTRAAISNFSNLEQVAEGGEYKSGTVTDAGETIQLLTYGKIFRITRQAIINDDLDAFTRIPEKLAAAAARLENRTVYDILNLNPVMSDGTALFHADHGNLTDALLSSGGIGAIRALARVQTDPSGNDNLNLVPAHLIVPAALEEAALRTKAPIVPNQISSAQPFAGTYDVIAEGYLDGTSTTNYFMACNTGDIDTIEYAYLDGQEGPYIEVKEGFSIDAVEMKVRHDFAAKAVDWRGLYKSTNDAS